MSSIIIRKKDAEEISTELLKKFLLFSDAFSIVYIRDEKCFFMREMDNDLFMESFRKKEKENLEMVIHFNDFWTGDIHHANLQPKYIKNIGCLIIDGDFHSTPNADKIIDNISPYFIHTIIKKSHEIMLAELFEKYSLAYKDLSPIVIWNRFLERFEKLIDNFTLVLILKDGRILNNRPDLGFYKSKGKLWYSEMKGENLLEIEEDEEEYDTSLYHITSAFDESELVIFSELDELDKTEIMFLCEAYPTELAILLKEGFINYSAEDVEELTDAEDAFLNDNDDEDGATCIQCNDCTIYFRKDSTKIISFLQNNVRKYKCSYCIESNGY